jgi:hypothetical protein
MGFQHSRFESLRSSQSRTLQGQTQPTDITPSCVEGRVKASGYFIGFDAGAFVSLGVRWRFVDAPHCDDTEKVNSMLSSTIHV